MSIPISQFAPPFLSLVYIHLYIPVSLFLLCKEAVLLRGISRAKPNNPRGHGWRTVWAWTGMLDQKLEKSILTSEKMAWRRDGVWWAGQYPGVHSSNPVPMDRVCSCVRGKRIRVVFGVVQSTACTAARADAPVVPRTASLALTYCRNEDLTIPVHRPVPTTYFSRPISGTVQSWGHGRELTS